MSFYADWQPSLAGEPADEPQTDSPAMTRPRLSNHIEFRYGPIHCTIETSEPIPANLWSWIGELAEAVERTARFVADHDAHVESQRQAEYEARLVAEYEARLPAETKKNTDVE